MRQHYAIPDWTNNDCALVEQMFASLEGRYSMLLMSAFALEGEMSFGRLRRELGINAKTLTQRLERLQQDGLIVNRRIMEGKVRKSYYSLNGNKDEFLHLLKAFRVYAKRVIHGNV